MILGACSSGAGPGGGAGEESAEAASGGGGGIKDVPAAVTGSPGMPGLERNHGQADVLDRLPGGGGPGCVQVGTARDVRSGGFAAGPFDTASAGVRPAEDGNASTVRLYFIPEHARSMPGVVVAGRDLGSGATFERHQRTVAKAERFRFYDLELPVTTGTWRITASAGPDVGCWTVALG